MTRTKYDNNKFPCRVNICKIASCKAISAASGLKFANLQQLRLGQERRRRRRTNYSMKI